MSIEGKKNIYTCETCGAHIVTVDTDAGVTPFLIPCEEATDCKGRMKSSVYRVDQNMKPSHGWYHPTSTAGFTRYVLDHVQKGGLLLRRIEP